MKPHHVGALFLILLLGGCSKYKLVEYNPANTTHQNSAAVIKEVIESQPQALAYLPSIIEVSDTYIKLFEGEIKSPTLMASIFFKNVKELKLFRSRDSSVWYVEIYDKQGYYMYRIYSYFEKDAKRFVDAMTFLLKTIT